MPIVNSIVEPMAQRVPVAVATEIEVARSVGPPLQFKTEVLPGLGNKLILIIEGNLPTTIERVRASLKEILPPYQIPKQIVVDAIFTMTENGKVNRQETTANIEI